MYALICVVMAIICSVCSMQAMLRSPGNWAKVLTAGRYTSSTQVRPYGFKLNLDPDSFCEPISADREHAEDDDWITARADYAYDKECSAENDRLIASLQEKQRLVDRVNMGMLLENVADIKRIGEVLELPLLHGFTTDTRVSTMRQQFCKERFPLVAAAEVLNNLDNVITEIIPQMEEIASLQREIDNFQRDQEIIRRTMDAIKRDPQWAEHSVAALRCARLQE